MRARRPRPRPGIPPRPCSWDCASDSRPEGCRMTAVSPARAPDPAIYQDSSERRANVGIAAVASDLDNGNLRTDRFRVPVHSRAAAEAAAGERARGAERLREDKPLPFDVAAGGSGK